MPAPRPALAARQRDIDVRTEFVNGEGLADDIDWTKLIKQSAQLLRCERVDFKVPILRLAAHQTIAHAAADKQRASARGLDSASEIHHLFGNHEHGANVPRSNPQVKMSA